MVLERDDHASVVTHTLAQHVLSQLRDVETADDAFREGLVELGRICGYELLDQRFATETTTIQTPLAETNCERLAREDVVLVNVLRAATPFVEGLVKAFPQARQGVISAGRDEAAGMDESGEFPITVDYVKLPDIDDDDTVIVADPMLATGSTMVAVLEKVFDAGRPERLVMLSAVSAPPGLLRVNEEFPSVDVLTVSIDERLDDDGYIVPGVGDAGDRAFGT